VLNTVNGLRTAFQFGTDKNRILKRIFFKRHIITLNFQEARTSMNHALQSCRCSVIPRLHEEAYMEHTQSKLRDRYSRTVPLSLFRSKSIIFSQS